MAIHQGRQVGRAPRTLGGTLHLVFTILIVNAMTVGLFIIVSGGLSKVSAPSVEPMRGTSRMLAHVRKHPGGAEAETGRDGR